MSGEGTFLSLFEDTPLFEKPGVAAEHLCRLLSHPGDEARALHLSRAFCELSPTELLTIVRLVETNDRVAIAELEEISVGGRMRTIVGHRFLPLYTDRVYNHEALGFLIERPWIHPANFDAPIEFIDRPSEEVLTARPVSSEEISDLLTLIDLEAKIIVTHIAAREGVVDVRFKRSPDVFGDAGATYQRRVAGAGPPARLIPEVRPVELAARVYPVAREGGRAWLVRSPAGMYNITALTDRFELLYPSNPMVNGAPLSCGYPQVEYITRTEELAFYSYATDDCCDTIRVLRVADIPQLRVMPVCRIERWL